jgi:hypothetical protein
MEKIPTNDIYMAAFLYHKGYRPELDLNNEGRNVTFVFEASNLILAAMAEYSTSPKVVLPEYVSALKILRSRMLARRKDGQDG